VAAGDDPLAVARKETLANGTVRRWLANGWFIDYAKTAAHRHNGWRYSAWEPGGTPDGFAAFRAGGDTLAGIMANLKTAAAAAPEPAQESPETPQDGPDAVVAPEPSTPAPAASPIDLGGGWTLEHRGAAGDAGPITAAGLAAAAAELLPAPTVAPTRGRGGRRKAPAAGQRSLFD
jgi:hypothetical protein